MQSARHDERYATSGIAAHPCKERKDGAPTVRYGKRRQTAEKGGPPAYSTIAVESRKRRFFIEWCLRSAPAVHNVAAIPNTKKEYCNPIAQS
jgi:hypothetical protein